MEFSAPRQRFYLELQQPEPMINLAAAALFIAQEEYPDLDVEEYLNTLDTMAMEVEERLPPTPYPLKVLKTINHYLFEDLKFAGNDTNYYDPKNSFLNDVIDRRVGIPITLSLVYLEVAKRLDFPMAGVGLPGHFLIRPLQEGMEIFVDAFHQGEILFPQDCQDRLNQIYAPALELQPEFLKPIGSRRFLSRMLTNLKMVYLNQGELNKALGAIERILMIFPKAPIELRDRGILYYHTGRWTEAKQDLSIYLEESPTAEDASIIQRLIEQIEQG